MLDAKLEMIRSVVSMYVYMELLESCREEGAGGARTEEVEGAVSSGLKLETR